MLRRKKTGLIACERSGMAEPFKMISAFKEIQSNGWLHHLFRHEFDVFLTGSRLAAYS